MRLKIGGMGFTQYPQTPITAISDGTSPILDRIIYCMAISVV